MKRWYIYFRERYRIDFTKFGNTETNVYSKCPKRQIISALISGFIGLALEGISSFLQHKREKALQQAMHTMNKRIIIK